MSGWAITNFFGIVLLIINKLVDRITNSFCRKKTIFPLSG